MREAASGEARKPGGMMRLQNLTAGRSNALPPRATTIWRPGCAGVVLREACMPIVPAAVLSLLVALDGMKCATAAHPSGATREG
jgi:hypothetical protein